MIAAAGGLRDGGVAVLGAGSWGTALAVHLGRIGHGVALWARGEPRAAGLAAARVNADYLPSVLLPEAVRPTASLRHALSGADWVVFAVPSHAMREVARQALPALRRGAVLVSAVKGLEAGSHARMSQVLQQETGGRFPIVVLSGPSFAAEVAAGLPTAILAASADLAVATAVQERFRGPSFRLYASQDVTGVEIGGALKNVIAIAAGVVEGTGLGHNAMAALITRGLAEISRLACAEGGSRETLAGLSGLGDLVLTCTGDLSRNRRVGIELGQGRPLPEILADLGMVAEGVRTTGAALALGERHGIELPITAQMAAVLGGGRTPREAVDVLMVRPQRQESETGSVAPAWGSSTRSNNR
jgi:glycerol-3-phosphate dehydrogenase (NAD(P)+)